MSFSEEALCDLINAGWDRMNREQRLLWDAVRLLPQEWELVSYGPCWAIGVMGPKVIYYNHHEYGFNWSSWSKFGFIDHYQSLQWELNEAIQQQLDFIRTGYDVGPKSSPPIAGVYTPTR